MKSDTRFQVTDQPRPLATNVSDLPPLSLVWRFLNAEHKRAVAAADRQQEERQRLGKVFVEIAESLHELRKLGRLPAVNEANSQTISYSLLGVAARIEAALAAFGVGIIAPEGEPYTDELMEIIENVAQRTDESSSAPFVAEIVVPAVIFRGELLRFGQAVIGIPATAPESDSIPDG
jgi:hypothetical protein